jgi:hypothetical protein
MRKICIYYSQRIAFNSDILDRAAVFFVHGPPTAGTAAPPLDPGVVQNMGRKVFSGVFDGRKNQCDFGRKGESTA